MTARTSSIDYLRYFLLRVDINGIEKPLQVLFSAENDSATRTQMLSIILRHLLEHSNGDEFNLEKLLRFIRNSNLCKYTTQIVDHLIAIICRNLRPRPSISLLALSTIIKHVQIPSDSLMNCLQYVFETFSECTPNNGILFLSLRAIKLLFRDPPNCILDNLLKIVVHPLTSSRVKHAICLQLGRMILVKENKQCLETLDEQIGPLSNYLWQDSQVRVSSGVMINDFLKKGHRSIFNPNVPLIPINATGVFIGCSEDEDKDVRMVSINSLAELLILIIEQRPNCPSNFISTAVYHIVDMMTDEENEVRICAMGALIKVLGSSKSDIKLSLNKIQVMTFNSEDRNKKIRQKCRQVYSICRVFNCEALALLIKSIFGCIPMKGVHFALLLMRAEPSSLSVAKRNYELLYQMKDELLGDGNCTNLDNPLFACTVAMVDEASSIPDQSDQWNLSDDLRRMCRLLPIEFVNKRKYPKVPIELIEPSSLGSEQSIRYFDCPVRLFYAGVPAKLTLKAIAQSDYKISKYLLFVRLTYPDGKIQIEEVTINDRNRIDEHVRIYSRNPWTSAAFIHVCLGRLDGENFVKLSQTVSVLVKAIDN
ncbi:hypothetical protein ACOME3_004393 [Neoechinorhynchus agilis]